MKLQFFNQSEMDIFNRIGSDVSDNYTPAKIGDIINLDGDSEEEQELIERLEELEHWQLSKFEAYCQ